MALEHERAQACRRGLSCRSRTRACELGVSGVAQPGGIPAFRRRSDACPARPIASRAIRSEPKRSGAAAISIRRPIRSCGSRPARLRRTLYSYYANGGADDPVVIALPIGKLCPDLHAARTCGGDRAERPDRAGHAAVAWSAGLDRRHGARRARRVRHGSPGRDARRQGHGPRQPAGSVRRRRRSERGGSAAPAGHRIERCAALGRCDAAGDDRARPHRRRSHDPVRCRRAAAEAAERAGTFRRGARAHRSGPAGGLASRAAARSGRLSPGHHPRRPGCRAAAADLPAARRRRPFGGVVEDLWLCRRRPRRRAKPSARRDVVVGGAGRGSSCRTSGANGRATAPSTRTIPAFSTATITGAATAPSCISACASVSSG